jgi:biopolymer transport protein TolR
MTGGSRSEFMSDINVTPFVDVMLVLLIIFMVTAPMMMQGVDVSLPEATSEPLDTEEDHLIVTIDKNNAVYISDYQVTVEALGEKLIKILEGRKNREVFLKADREITYGTVMKVMSELKGAGVDNLGMVTEPDTTDKKGKKTRAKK